MKKRFTEEQITKAIKNETHQASSNELKHLAKLQLPRNSLLLAPKLGVLK